MAIPESVLVIGHRNPDMDAIASAIGYAWYLNEVSTSNTHYIAGRTGEPNAQTKFALERFQAEAPELVTDVRARLADVMEDLAPVQKDQPILNACQNVASTRRPVPVIDADHKPVGLLTSTQLFAKLGDALTSAAALWSALENQADDAVEDTGIIVNADEFVQEVTAQLLRVDQDDFLVVDADGRYVGLLHKSALFTPPHRRVVLVDHNEVGQAVSGLAEAELFGVLDHHRISSLPTSTPITFKVEPVGSTSTLVTEEAYAAGLRVPASIAGLLLSGILSDTLTFRSPTVTERDKKAAAKLAVWAGLAAEGASSEEIDAAIQAYGQELLAAGAGLGSRTGIEIVNTDVKYYEVGALKSGLAQVEVTGFTEITARLDELKDVLSGMLTNEQLALALLMITDIVTGNSRLLVVGQPRVIAALPYPTLSENLLDAPGVMSRKKQLLPAVLAALEQGA